MKPATSSSTNIIALDVGGQRVGVARANTVARLSSPLKTLVNDDKIFDKIIVLAKEEQAEAVVVGLPRGLNGQETAQTKTVRDFCMHLKKLLSIPIYLQDETLTSVKAEEELALRQKNWDKGTVDALAAAYILQDFLSQNKAREEINNG